MFFLDGAEENVYNENTGCSYYSDDDTGLYYCNARYYSPKWRRFISPDDTAYLDPESVNGLNLYCYCGNDPINYADPNGNNPILIGLGIGALVGAVLGFATVIYTDYQDDMNVFNGSVKWHEYALGTFTGAALGAGVGAIIAYGKKAVVPALAGLTSKFITDTYAYILTGASYGTWEDYAVAFISGGLIKGFGAGKVEAKLFDILLRPMLNQIVKIGTNRQDAIMPEKYAFDVLTRLASVDAPPSWKPFFRGLIKSIWDIIKDRY